MSSIEMVVGTVDEVEGHYVATVFVGFGGPWFPLRSMYVHSVQYDRVAGGSRVRYQGSDLPLVWPSVLLGYARVWLGWLSFAMPWITMYGQAFEFDLSRWEWQVCLATLIAWIATFVPGRLSAQKKKELAVIGRATGAYLDPARLDRLARLGRRSLMEPVLKAAGVAPDAAAAGRSLVARADGKLLEILYAYARYAQLDEPAWAPVAAESWQKLQRV
jgi:hypothetical protein